MATNYPTSLDTTTQLDTTIDGASDTLDSPSHSDQHENVNGAAIALETKLGIGSSNAAGAQTSAPLVHVGSGTSQWQAMSATAGVDVTLYSTTAGDNVTWDASAAKLTVTGTDATVALDVPDGYAQFAEAIQANGGVTGDVTGNASTATALETARTIGGVSFDGTANINLPGVNATGNQDTTGNAATATSATSATSATTATTATNATNVTLAATSNTTTYPVLATSATGNQAPKTDAGLTYNASTNELTTGSMTLTGGGAAIEFTGSSSNITWDTGDWISFDTTANAWGFVTGSSTLVANIDEGDVGFRGQVRPLVDDSYSCGTASYRWTAVYATNGTIQTSDATLKEISDRQAPGMAFIRLLDSREWEWKDEESKDGVHWGPTAQNIQEALKAVGSESSMVVGEEGNLGVRESDLFGAVINALKEQEARIEELEERIQRLENG